MELVMSLHYMYVLHRFGPLRHHWCMRFESKNAQIKHFLSPKSYRNVALSVSIHHQMWMCYQLLTEPEQSTSNFLYSGDDIISGKQFNNIYSQIMCIFVYSLIIMLNGYKSRYLCACTIANLQLNNIC